MLPSLSDFVSVFPLVFVLFSTLVTIHNLIVADLNLDTGSYKDMRTDSLTLFKTGWKVAGLRPIFIFW